jgi:hypothetical protein
MARTKRSIKIKVLKIYSQKVSIAKVIRDLKSNKGLLEKILVKEACKYI